MRGPPGWPVAKVRLVVGPESLGLPALGLRSLVQLWEVFFLSAAQTRTRGWLWSHLVALLGLRGSQREWTEGHN